MLNSRKKIRALRHKKNRYSNSRVVRKKKILNETKNHNPSCKLNGRSLKVFCIFFETLYIYFILASEWTSFFYDEE